MWSGHLGPDGANHLSSSSVRSFNVWVSNRGGPGGPMQPLSRFQANTELSGLPSYICLLIHVTNSFPRGTRRARERNTQRATRAGIIVRGGELAEGLCGQTSRGCWPFSLVTSVPAGWGPESGVVVRPHADRHTTTHCCRGN
jgi:hypothetical protein